MADGRFYDFPGDERKYVSVTTFLGIIGKQQYLMPWAAKMERELIKKLYDQGLTWDEAITYLEPKQPYGYQLSNEVASEFGNKIHKAIDYTLKGLKLPRMNKAERKVYDKWLEWWGAQGYDLEGAEEVVRCKRWGYAGTLDARVLKHNKRKILDWKTGKNHYDEHDLQNLSYQMALQETGHTCELGGELVYIPKDKEIWTSDVPVLTDDNFTPALNALGLWRWANKKPWKEN